jgi:hypothetical protein
MHKNEGPVLAQEEAIRIIESGWRLRRMCCRDAVIVHCVCRISVRCPTHGRICVGSHD